MSTNESTPSTPSPMSLQEARKVLWLRSNYRPMGELLDAGYLNARRLAWAAEKAYDAHIRQAAGVLLDFLRGRTQPAPAARAAPDDGDTPPALEAGLTIKQARATHWPFRPFRGEPMGALVDARQLRLKDLLHAIENAWDERVQRAASVLLTLRLDHVVKEPPPAAGPLKVLSGGRSFYERSRLRWAVTAGALIGAVMVLGAVGVVLLARWVVSGPGGADVETPSSTLGAVIAIAIWLLLLACAYWLINRLTDLASRKFEAQIEAMRKGEKGEEEVVEALRQILDGRWTLLRNVTLPGRNKADIDAVLAGPPGVWALEIKNFSGRYRNIGERWQFRSGRRWRSVRSSPSRQAQNNAARLANFLRADKIKQWIEPAVVWVNSEGLAGVNNPMVAVWRLDRLPEELGNVWQGQKLSEERQARIVEKLASLRREGEEEDL